MNFNWHIWNILKKHLINVFIFFIGMNVMVFISFIVVFDRHINYLNTQMQNNVSEYDEVDREQLCRITQCTEVNSVLLKKTWVPDREGLLKKHNYIQHDYIQVFNHLFLDKQADIFIYNKDSDSFYNIDVNSMLSDYIYLISAVMLLGILLFIYPLIKSISSEQEESILMLAGNEALLSNKSMINITENIHHELNTPLEVIDNKVEKIRRKLNDIVQEQDKKIDFNIKTMEEDFNFIKNSSEQIYAVLEKMKGFKHLRYSNGNKSIKNIIEGGFKIINISNTNFEYNVDKKLSMYKINSDYLKNADLLSVTLNHIKNSLDAYSSKIFILFTGFENGFLRLRIIDNGNGIPENFKKKVFIANFSTKGDDGSIRGNGMYLNRHILRTAQGDVTLISSSSKGTTIELKIPAIEK